jgi:hypothetical protein
VALVVLHSGELEPFEILKLDGSGLDRVACLPVLPVTVTGLAKDGSWIDPVNERALIDTGADTTHIEKSFADDLDLKVVGEAWAGYGSQRRLVPAYRITLTITGPGGDGHNWTLTAPVREISSGYAQSFRILVGANVLADCRLTCDGTTGPDITWPDGTVAPVGTFTLELPDRS